MRQSCLFFILLSLSNFSYSQNFEWLKSFGTKSNNEVVFDISAEKNGGCVIFLGNSGGQFTTTDTLTFDTTKFFVYKNSNPSFLVSLDSNGNVLKAKSIGKLGFSGFCSDNIGNYYLSGLIQRDQNNYIDSIKLDIAKGRAVIAKFDSHFNLVWFTQIGNDSTTTVPKLKFSDGQIYFNVGSTDSTTIGSNIYSLGNKASFIFGLINSINGVIIWSNYLYMNTSNTRLVISDIVKLGEKLYLTGEITASGFNGPKISSDTFYPGSGFVVQTDTFGRYEKRFLIQSKGTRVLTATSDGYNLFLGGAYIDTLVWGNKKLPPDYLNGGITPYELFAASLTPSLKPRWFFRPKIINQKRFQNFGNVLYNATYSKGFIYFGGVFVSKILIDSNILTPKTQDILIFKTDSIGNVLWAAQGGTGLGAINTLDAIAGKSVFSGGRFSDTITLGKYSKISKGYQDGFITKITDYSITRGRVSSGPYCAGDTIKIPFTKFGIFDSSNTFIAQLSDEYGNFVNHFELGRLKSNKDGVIIGKLPMFKVASSKLYRIRILSTSPKVQSYYRTDTLRLLIYSKDKADPGPPETICKGDTLKLITYGGTKWIWGPKYNINNITYRQPLVWPMKDTLYRIVIADSSGCGKPDTAFKKVIVRPYPKSNLQFTDTSICENIPLKIPVRFSGGDSTYLWEWFFVNPDKSLFSMKKGKSKFTDTLFYKPSVDQKNSEKLAITLKDGCTSKADTSYLNIIMRKSVLINNQFMDTVLCSGQTLNYKAFVSGGVPNYYKYQWKYLISNIVLSDRDTLKIVTPKTEKIQLIVNDGCEVLGDTVQFTITVKSPLKAITNLRDTTICYSQKINYTASAKGGDTKAYKFSWMLDSKQISDANTLLLNINNYLSASTFSLYLILKDNCSVPNDTIKKTIIVIPSPIANFIWDMACSRTITNFQFTGTKPLFPISTSYSWNFNNEATSFVENPSHQFAGVGMIKATLIIASTNGCMDSLTKTIEIKPQSKANFTAADLCENDSAVFINKSQDATGYDWKFGDGLNSTKSNPKHKYQISTSTTFNVTLLALVTNGCADSITQAVTVNKSPSSEFSYVLSGSKVDLKIAINGNSYLWKFGTTDSVKTNETTYTHYIKSSDQYNVCLRSTDIAGCISQTCKNVTVSISDLDKLNSFIIYPNPNSGSFIIKFEVSKTNRTIEIIDQIGQIVHKEEFYKSPYHFDSNLANGIYLVKIISGGKAHIQRIMVNK